MIGKTITKDDANLLLQCKGKFLLNSDNRLYKLKDYVLTTNTYSGEKLFLESIDLQYCDLGILEVCSLNNTWIKQNLFISTIQNWRNRYLFIQNQYKFFNLELVDYKEPSHTYNNNEEKI